jgi:hypothetical protein
MTVGSNTLPGVCEPVIKIASRIVQHTSRKVMDNQIPGSIPVRNAMSQSAAIGLDLHSRKAVVAVFDNCGCTPLCPGLHHHSFVFSLAKGDCRRIVCIIDQIPPSVMRCTFDRRLLSQSYHRNLGMYPMLLENIT